MKLDDCGGGSTAWGDAPRRKTAGAVTFIGWNDELALLAHLHAHAPLVPACNTRRVSFATHRDSSANETTKDL